MTSEVRKLLGQRSPFNDEGPRPLTRENVDQEPYPVEALGDLQEAVGAIHEHTHAPLAICAQSVLGALSLVLQGHVDIRLPTGSRRPLSLFLITIAESGARKSAVDGHALKLIYDFEKQLQEQYDRDHLQYVNQRALWDLDRKQILKESQSKKKRVEAENDLHALGDEPEAPLIPMLVCPEPTFEGYCKLTAVGQPSMGIYSAEGGSFIGRYGMSADHRLRTAAGLSSLWDGDPIKRVRVTDGTTILPGRRLSLHLMAQPEVSLQLLGDDLLVSQGLLSRCLVSAPPSAAGTRNFAVPRQQAVHRLDEYHRMLCRLLKQELPIRAGTRNELQPRTLRISDEAEQIWIRLHDYVEERLGEDGEFASISGFANKAAEHAARIAGLFAMWRDLQANQVSAEDMANAARLVHHYLAEALRLRGEALASKHLNLAARVWEWLLHRWEHSAVYPAAIYNDCPITAVRNRKSALRIIATLEEHGYLIRAKDGRRINGAHRKEAWQIYGRSDDENLEI
ncbi:MAG: DUF3987 domain-containing protein [Hyphomicrobiaceae bacterium TMED74]|nr:hypothetical protein [Filomicrobium sp.]RPG38519.1 MAG: DUF3987 domain-containing protein [Hyphomicrobiaceae bacterium TMED74]